VSGKYRTIVADPPWEYEPFVSINRTAGKWSEKVKKPLPYSAMSMEEIAELPMTEWADPSGCRLFLWTTNRYLPDAFKLVETWGFTYRQTLVWHKVNGPPFVTSVAPNHAEYLLVATVGKPAREEPLKSSVFSIRHNAKVHSKKPEMFLDLIEQVSPRPYLELFARRARFGWDYWGDQSLGTAEMPEVAA
jgi:N6-adenosine-specific RNA methylase IME4